MLPKFNALILNSLGVEYRLIAIDEFHHVSANPDNKLGSQLGELLHIAATRQSINIKAVYITTEDKGYVQSSDTKSVCLFLRAT